MSRDTARKPSKPCKEWQNDLLSDKASRVDVNKLSNPRITSQKNQEGDKETRALARASSIRRLIPKRPNPLVVGTKPSFQEADDLELDKFGMLREAETVQQSKALSYTSLVPATLKIRKLRSHKGSLGNLDGDPPDPESNPLELGYSANRLEYWRRFFNAGPQLMDSETDGSEDLGDKLFERLLEETKHPNSEAFEEKVAESRAFWAGIRKQLSRNEVQD